MRNLYLPLLFLLFLSGCKNDKQNPENQTPLAESKTEASKETSASDWQDLLNQENASAWRAYNGSEGLPEGWRLEGDVLRSLGTGADIGGDIVYGGEEFGEFELVLEWKIAPGGNSGIFYHVVEGVEYKAPYFTGPEFQLRDHRDNGGAQDPLHSLGADYAMYAPGQGKEVTREAGTWNSSRILFTAEKVTYWLNGQKTVEFVPWSEEWKERKQSGKWRDYPAYGEARQGLIGLQDHGSEIQFRNIRIRKLDE